MVKVYERKPKSAWYAERDARWAEAVEEGKTVKQIALENCISIWQVYKCVRRVRFLEEGKRGCIK